MYVCVYICIYIYIYTHTYMYTCIYYRSGFRSRKTIRVIVLGASLHNITTDGAWGLSSKLDNTPI